MIGLSHPSTPQDQRKTRNRYLTPIKKQKNETPINLNHPPYNENKQRQKDWTNEKQIKIIWYLSKDFIQPRSGKSFKKYIIIRSEGTY